MADDITRVNGFLYNPQVNALQNTTNNNVFQLFQLYSARVRLPQF